MQGNDERGGQVKSREEYVASQLSEFAAALQDAREKYGLDTTSEHRRRAAKISLGACILLVIRTIPSGIDVVKPLRELFDCLDDLDSGIKPAMLTSPRRKGGRRTSRGVETFRATVAVLMEAYQQKGDRRDDAAEATAHDLNHQGYRDEKGRELTARRIEDWRDKVKEGGFSLGAERFRAQCESVEPYRFEEARQLILDSLSLIPSNRIVSGAT